MEIQNYIDTLNKCPLFNNIDNIKTLFDTISYNVYDFKKNTLIHQTNEICNNLIIILTGTLSLECTNKPIVIYRFNSSDIIGANTIFSPDNHFKLDVYSKSDCLLLYIPTDEVLNLCLNNKIFLKNFITHMSIKSQSLISKVTLLLGKTLRQSIIEFIKYNYEQTKLNTIYLDITKTELAELIGVERTSLSRELKSMKDEGLIDFNRNSITLLKIKNII